MPTTAIEESSEPSLGTKPRRPWLAALLSLLFFPMGQLYAGSLWRAVGLEVCEGVLLYAGVVALFVLRLGPVGFWILLAGYLLFRIAVLFDAYFLARRQRDEALRWYQRWWIYPIAFVMFAFLHNGMAETAQTFVGEAFVVPTRSMNPTILPGDRILVDKCFFDPHKLQRDDLVVFYSEGPDSPPFVMRVLGLPGETIKIIDEVVYINGKAWVDRFANREGPIPEQAPEMANLPPLTLAADACFVLGDNRHNARDSRFLGPIPLSDMIGKARLIYWSSERIPDPDDPEHFTTGAIRWDRMGTRLD